MLKALFVYLSLLSVSTLAAIDERLPEKPTSMTKSNMIRFQYLSQSGAECTAGNSTKLISRVPFYVYAPSNNATQVASGKYGAVVFLHGRDEQGASVPNMCYPRSDSDFTTISNNLIRVENTAGGPGAAILNGLFKPQEKMVVIIPQSMQQGGFTADVIRRVVEDAAQQLAAKGIELDADRLYLTGLSMGGGSLLSYIAANPDHFAAVVPIEAAAGINPCFVQANNIALWGFAGALKGNMYASNLSDTIYGSSGCLLATYEYTNAAYNCKYNNKSCTILSASNPSLLRATFMPNEGHGGWVGVYNGTHSALPTSEKNIYNWMLSHRNSDFGKPLFPIAYKNGVSTTSSSAQSSSSSIKTSSSSSSSTAIINSSSSQSSSSSSSAAVVSGNRIILSSSMIMSGAPGNPQALVDEQTTVGNPLTATGTKALTSWDVWGLAFPVSAVIDLGQEYELTDILLYDSNGISKFEVAAGTPGNFGAPIVVDAQELYEAWKKYKVNTKTRYLKLTKYGAAAMREILIYGKLPTSAPMPPTSTESKSIDLSNAQILEGAQGNPQALIDEQTSSSPGSSWFTGWQTTYPVEATIDLGKEYTITEISLYDANGTGQIEISDGDLSHSQTAVVTDQLLNYLTFNSHTVNLKTRYLRVTKFNNAAMNEIKIKGY